MRRPNLSQFVLLMILIAVPIVQWVVHRNTGRTAAAATEVDVAPEEPVPARDFLSKEVSPSVWAQSAGETADLITDLGRIGRINDAVEVANYALALPRHPDTNNPFGYGHATLALDRMLEIFLAYEMWDELIAFSTKPDAVAIGDAMVESKRLRSLGVAFANKRQLTFRSRILTQQLNEAKDALDQREANDEHHNEICSPQDRVEIDHDGNKAARKHIQSSIACVDAQLSAMKKDYKSALETLTATDASPLQAARIVAKSGDTAAATSMLSKFANTTPFRAAALTALAEIQWSAKQSAAATQTLGELNSLIAAFPVDSTLRKRLRPIVQQSEIASTWHTAPETLAAAPAGFEKLQADFPLTLPAPAFSLPGINDNKYSLEAYRGKPVLVVFYLGRGCLHCSRQLKQLAPTAFEFDDLGISILGISTDSIDTLSDSFASYRGRIPYPLAANAELTAFEEYRLFESGMEEPLHGTFLIDEEGQVLWRDSGEDPFMDMEFLLTEFRRLLQRS